MHYFYTPIPDFLASEETNHAKNVLRLKTGDIIKSFDGFGFFYNSKIVSFSKTETKLEILSKIKQQKCSNYDLKIGICPTKNSDRMEWFVEKATEIGIHSISFLHSSRTQRKNINLERMQKMAISAAKQSIKAKLPVLIELQNFEKFVVQDFENTSKFIAHLENSNRKLFFDELKEVKTQNILVLIGPEGDFSQVEIELAKKKQLQTCKFWSE